MQRTARSAYSTTINSTALPVVTLATLHTDDEAPRFPVALQPWDTPRQARRHLHDDLTSASTRAAHDAACRRWWGYSAVVLARIDASREGR